MGLGTQILSHSIDTTAAGKRLDDLQLVCSAVRTRQPTFGAFGGEICNLSQISARALGLIKDVMRLSRREFELEGSGYATPSNGNGNGQRT